MTAWARPDAAPIHTATRRPGATEETVMKTQPFYGGALHLSEHTLERETIAYRVRRRRRVSFLFSASLVAAYFAFVLLVTAKTRALNGQLVSGLSVAMLLGVVVILGCLASTTAYIVWLGHVQRAHDRAVRRGAAHENG